MDILLNIIGENVMHYIGRVFVLLAVCLIAVLGYAGLFIVVPLVSEPWSMSYYVHCIVGSIVLFSIYFNYYHAINTNPGKYKV